MLSSAGMVEDCAAPANATARQPVVLSAALSSGRARRRSYGMTLISPPLSMVTALASARFSMPFSRTLAAWGAVHSALAVQDPSYKAQPICPTSRMRHGSYIGLTPDRPLLGNPRSLS